jgi:hypothetical protein
MKTEEQHRAQAEIDDDPASSPADNSLRKIALAINSSKTAPGCRERDRDGFAKALRAIAIVWPT